MFVEESEKYVCEPVILIKGASHKCFTFIHSGKKVFAVYNIHASAIVWLLLRMLLDAYTRGRSNSLCC